MKVTRSYHRSKTLYGDMLLVKLTDLRIYTLLVKYVLSYTWLFLSGANRFSVTKCTTYLTFSPQKVAQMPFSSSVTKPGHHIPGSSWIQLISETPSNIISLSNKGTKNEIPNNDLITQGYVKIIIPTLILSQILFCLLYFPALFATGYISLAFTLYHVDNLVYWK